MVMECIWSFKQSINTCNYAKNAILKKTIVLKGLIKQLHFPKSQLEHTIVDSIGRDAQYIEYEKYILQYKSMLKFSYNIIVVAWWSK